jgi:hypothetical protein
MEAPHGCEYHAEWDVLFPPACSAFLCLDICEFLLQSMKHVIIIIYLVFQRSTKVDIELVNR